MQINKIQTIFIGLGIVLLALGFVFYKNFSAPSSSVNNSTTTPKVTVIKDENGNEYIVEEVPVVPNDIAVPDLNRKVVFGSSVSLDENTRKIVSDKIAVLQSELKKDSKLLSKWLDLGLYQKMAGDYTGASLSWEYVSKVATTDYISLGNLGDLYAYYIKDKIKSENYFKRAIANGPTQTYLYAQLSGVYKDVFGDLVKARSIIDQGLSKNPNNPNLLETKENLK